MMTTVHGEPSHHLGTAELDLHVTERAGHLAPVVFHLPGRDVSPYALAPWEPGEYPDIPSLLAVLRGDFLCLPFGEQAAGPPHGDNAVNDSLYARPRPPGHLRPLLRRNLGGIRVGAAGSSVAGG